MSKTVDDLAWIYLNAFAEEGGHDITAVSKPDPRTVEGIAAVVRALRDEFGRIMYPGDDWNRQGILEQFDQILGDAGEKVAGSTPEGAVLSSSAEGEPLASPATDPAPAVCEWTQRPNKKWRRGCCGGEGWRYAFKDCPCCKAPIKFTEAK